MPELPEVETTCREIEPVILNQELNRVIVRQSQLRWPIPNALCKLKNVRIKSVTRRAKYILIQTTKGTIIIHLGMSGILCALDTPLPPQKHDHVDIIMKNQTYLRYTDPRRFGAILWTVEEPLQHKLLINLGPEPFSESFNANYLFCIAKEKKIMVKKFIMDQSVVVGIGNIYANEALFMAKILPSRLSNSLTEVECQRLIKEIGNILKKAILKGGTTLRNFLSPNGKPGYFIQELFVYGREGEECKHCDHILEGVRINQRATVFCPKCQQ